MKYVSTIYIQNFTYTKCAVFFTLISLLAGGNSEGTSNSPGPEIAVYTAESFTAPTTKINLLDTVDKRTISKCFQNFKFRQNNLLKSKLEIGALVKENRSDYIATGGDWQYEFKLVNEELPCDIHEIEEFNISIGNLTLSENEGIFSFENNTRNNLYWTPNGQFKISQYEFINPGHYCVQKITDLPRVSKSDESDVVSNLRVRVCPNSKLYTKTAFAANVVGAIILLVVVITHALLWNSLNVHSWTIGMFSIVSFLRLLNIASIYLVEDFYRNPDNKTALVCVFKAVFHNIFQYSTITWMTILNYDVWTTLRSMKRTSTVSKGKTRFMVYCLLGFGLPTIHDAIYYGIQAFQSPFSDRLDVSNTGPFLCTQDAAPAVFITGITLFLICLIFAILTVKGLSDAKKESDLVSSSSRVSRSQVKIVLKLFVLMGISLIFQMVFWALLNIIFFVEWYSAVDSTIIILNSLSTFWIILCNKKTKDQLTQKYSFFKSTFSYMDSNIKKLRVSLSLKSNQSDGSKDSTSTNVSTV